MNKIKIICESISDLPIKIEDVDVLPITIIFEGKEYKAGVDLDTDEFYKKLRNSSSMPTTSQVTYAVFKEAFEKYVSEGYKVLYLAGSSAASGTYQSAVIAKNDLGSDDIYIFDTFSLSAGAGILVYEAYNMVQEGKYIDYIIETLEKYKEKVHLFFSVDSLDYLQKGGRISGATATIGNLLNIKPILNIEDGLVKQKSKVRGSKKIMPTLIKELKDSINGDFSEKIVYVGYGDDITLRDEFVKKVKEELSPKEVFVFQIGSCIASHSGPDVLGLGCLDI